MFCWRGGHADHNRAAMIIRKWIKRPLLEMSKWSIPQFTFIPAKVSVYSPINSHSAEQTQIKHIHVFLSTHNSSEVLGSSCRFAVRTSNINSAKAKANIPQRHQPPKHHHPRRRPGKEERKWKGCWYFLWITIKVSKIGLFIEVELSKIIKTEY